jgi:hypothetical protein
MKVLAMFLVAACAILLAARYGGALLSSNQRRRWKIYHEDIQLFFAKHPVAQVVYTFSLYFTYWSLFELSTSWTFLPPRSFRSYVIGAAFFATCVTIAELAQGWARRRSSRRSGDATEIV